MSEYHDLTKFDTELTGDYRCDRSVMIRDENPSGSLSSDAMYHALKANYNEYIAIYPNDKISFDEYVHDCLITLAYRMADIEFNFNAGRLTRAERDNNIELCKETFSAIKARFPHIACNVSRGFVAVREPQWVKELKAAGVCLVDYGKAEKYSPKEVNG